MITLGAKDHEVGSPKEATCAEKDDAWELAQLIVINIINHMM